MELIYHPDAEAELIESAQFYEERLPTLGGQFLDEFESAIREIQNSPRQWRVVESDVRLYLLSKFPFSIYFRVGLDQIRILAIKHHSRHPDYWRGRLED
jgi:toxin ParE1/3/4